MDDHSPTKKGSPETTKKPKTKKQAELDIDFTKALDEEMPDIFSHPKNPKSLLLPSNRGPWNTILPEDCHYQPEDLIKLFLLPNITVILVIQLWDCLLLKCSLFLFVIDEDLF